MIGILQGGAPESFGTRDFHDVTTLHPVGLVVIISLIVALWLVPRRHAVIPFLLSACLIPASQRLIITNLDFNFLRLLVLAGWLRLALRKEYGWLRWSRLDTLVLSWSLVSAVAYVLLHGTFGSAVYRAGLLYDALGLYLFFRCIIRTPEDVQVVARAVAIVAVPVAMVFAVEKTTGRNVFAFLGGVPELTIVRAGRLRVQGPFPHAILAGCFFAAWLPLVAGLWRQFPFRAAAGVFAILVIVVMCASSTPVGGVAAAAVGMMFWALRVNMRSIRWGVGLSLIALHFVMKAPVWHLLSRISFSQGSTSHHRFLLIDNAIKRVDEWALIGTKDTSHWGHAMFDLTNQFVAEGVKGGLGALVLFVAVLSAAFGLVGQLSNARSLSQNTQLLAWSLGACLFVHAVMFMAISITHSQQALLVFYFVLAAIGSLGKVHMDARAGERREVANVD